MDYVEELDGTVLIADGQETGQIVVPLINDSDLENVEKFSVSLFGVDGAELGFPRTVEIIIVDDESGPDLVGYWNFDEESGTTASDSSDYSNTGIHNNFDGVYGISTDRVTTFESSNNTRSLRFDGQDDVVWVNNAPSLNLTAGPYTQSVWIKPVSTSTDGYQGIIGFDDGTGSAQRYPCIYTYQRDRIHAGFGDDSTWNSITTDPCLTLDEWNHVAVTFDGISFIVYVNGELVFTTNDFAGRTPVARGEYDLSIGYIDNYFEGNIDEVRIYNRALAANEILNELIDGAISTVLLTGKFVLETVVSSGLILPNGFVMLSDGRMLVSEKIGRIQLFEPDGVTRSTFLDITDIVNEGNDRGMLGFVVDPNYDFNRHIYVAYTYDPPEVQNGSGAGGPNGRGARVSRISRFTANQNGTFVDPASELVLIGNNSTYANIGTPHKKPKLTDPHSCGELDAPVHDCIPADEDSHTIGDLEFGLDGMLYCSTGDGGSYGRVDIVNWRSQELDSLSGKILRIDPLTGQGLPDNPFYDGDPDSNRSKVWMLGLRNPYRFSIHPIHWRSLSLVKSAGLLGRK